MMKHQQHLALLIVSRRWGIFFGPDNEASLLPLSPVSEIPLPRELGEGESLCIFSPSVSSVRQRLAQVIDSRER